MAYASAALPVWFSALAVLVEALALALPPYPRCEDAELPEGASDPDDPGDDAARRPFQGLADLLGRKDN